MRGLRNDVPGPCAPISSTSNSRPTSIALRPASPRDAARMLVVQRDGVLRDRAIGDLPQWLEPGDQLVVNDTKVISAQLKGRRIGRETEPKIEATLIKRLDGSRWQALVKPAQKARARRHRSLRQ